MTTLCQRIQPTASATEDDAVDEEEVAANDDDAANPTPHPNQVQAYAGSVCLDPSGRCSDCTMDRTLCRIEGHPASHPTLATSSLQAYYPPQAKRVVMAA